MDHRASARGQSCSRPTAPPAGQAKIWIRIFPHKPISSKPAETRMGKGKGDIDYWAACGQAGNGACSSSATFTEDTRQTGASSASLTRCPIKVKHGPQSGLRPNELTMKIEEIRSKTDSELSVRPREPEEGPVPAELSRRRHPTAPAIPALITRAAARRSRASRPCWSRARQAASAARSPIADHERRDPKDVAGCCRAPSPATACPTRPITVRRRAHVQAPASYGTSTSAANTKLPRSPRREQRRNAKAMYVEIVETRPLSEAASAGGW